MLGFPRAPYLDLCFFSFDIVNQMTLLYTYLVVDNEYEAADQLNKDIESIHQWSQKWLIKFNPDNRNYDDLLKTSQTPPSPCLHGSF